MGLVLRRLLVSFRQGPIRRTWYEASNFETSFGLRRICGAGAAGGGCGDRPRISGHLSAAIPAGQPGPGGGCGAAASGPGQGECPAVRGSGRASPFTSATGSGACPDFDVLLMAGLGAGDHGGGFFGAAPGCGRVDTGWCFSASPPRMSCGSICRRPAGPSPGRSRCGTESSSTPSWRQSQAARVSPGAALCQPRPPVRRQSPGGGIPGLLPPGGGKGGAGPGGAGGTQI